MKNYKVVLVCMDNFVNEIYQTKFKKLGIELAVVNKTDESFIEQMAKLMPNLILLGIVMTNLDGYKLTEMLKADPRTKDISIIGFSNVSGKEEIKRGLELGMEDYWSMSKYSPDEIIKKVTDLNRK